MDPTSQINNNTSNIEANKSGRYSLTARANPANDDYKSCFVNLKRLRTVSLPSLNDPNIDQNCVVNLKKLRITPLKLRIVKSPPKSCPKLAYPAEIDHIATQYIAKFDMSSVQTFGSEEISDQDISCKVDMEKILQNLNHINENRDLLDISEFSIEPSSDPSEDEERSRSKKMSNDIFTLSISENSSNAVDNYIAVSDRSAGARIVSELSFNGIIGNAVAKETDEVISKINEVCADTETKPEAIIESVHDKSTVNMEIFQSNTSRELINERSPDIFQEDEDEEEEEAEEREVEDANTTPHELSSTIINDSQFNPNQSDGACIPIEKREKRLMRQLQNLLSGILPPPSVTVIEHDITKILSLYKTNKTLMEPDNDDLAKNCASHALPLIHDDDVKTMNFSEAIEIKNYGVHYNRTQYSDNIEIMYMKLAQRHIGQETGSSFTYFWPAHKKIIKKS